MGLRPFPTSWVLAAAALGACFIGDNPGFEGTEAGTSASSATASATAAATTTSAGTTTSGGTTATAASGTTADPVDTDTTGAAAGYADVVIADGPLAYWRLGEAFAPAVVDEMGNFPGIYYGGVGFEEPGALAGDPDTAVRFGAGDAKVLFGDVLDFTGVPTMSVEAWIKPESIESNWPKILVNLDGDNNGWGFVLNEYNGISVGFIVWAGTNDGVYGVVETGVWTHVVGTHDGVTLRLYMNGVEVSTKISSLAIVENDAELAMGGNSSEAGRFPGPLDEVAVYDYALTPAQIEAHYVAGSGL